MVEGRSLRKRVRAQGLKWDSPKSFNPAEKAERNLMRGGAQSAQLPNSSHSELA